MGSFTTMFTPMLILIFIRTDYAHAVDCVDRTLFTYERSFLGTFTFTNETNRLDYDNVENRAFFLAVHR